MRLWYTAIQPVPRNPTRIGPATVPEQGPGDPIGSRPTSDRIRPSCDTIRGMPAASSRSIVLVPLDVEMVRTRLTRQDFRLDRPHGGASATLHFGTEFPGDALALYPGLLVAIGDAPVVDGTFVVVDQLAGEAVGQVGSIGAPDGPTVEIGYGVNASAQGQGIATTAVALVLEAFRSRSPRSAIIARTSVDNRASRRVLEKNGFEVTGRGSSDEGPLLLWSLSDRRGARVS